MSRTRARWGFLITALSVLCLLPVRMPHAVAQILPPGFHQEIVFSELVAPTAVEFASDGRVFVAEKSGLIRVFLNLSATVPAVFADLRTNVHNYEDRGLLGMALHPDFPTTPYVYVLYTHDAAIGGTAPRWGTVGGTSDDCPTPPGPNTDGCVVSGRLSRLEAAGDVMTGPEIVLLEGWCQQFSTHSIGSLAFGPDGALYVSGGDGASYKYVDYGQTNNPCADPPSSGQTPPTAEGGALRSQSLERPGNQDAVLNGAMLRVDPNTGNALPDNPLAASSDPNRRRTIAYGLRNPFRFTIRPNTSELWIGDVGWSAWDEINRIANPTGGVQNFGWPCFEGEERQPGYDSANLDICESLYDRPNAVSPPAFSYNHSNQIIPGENCPAGNSAISGLAFYNGGSYPPEYSGSLFFADYARGCIWTIFDPAGAGGGTLEAFVQQASTPVQLKIGPNGDLFYVDVLGGTIRRIRYGTNGAPVAVARASATSGSAPLTVNFDGTASSDPDPGDTLTYAWDLDGDGQFNDSTAAQPLRTYTSDGTYTARLRVTDNHGASSTASIVITVGLPNTPPTARIISPVPSTTWKVGDAISLSGQASDPDEPLPDSAFSWKVIMHDCPSSCHAHVLTDLVGVSTASFSAPDAEYPSHIEIQLTATDSQGATDTKSVLIYPQTVALDFQSVPTGLQLTVGLSSSVAPFSLTVIVGSANSVSATTPQALAGSNYQFVSWSDGGTQTHNITAGAVPVTYTATYSTSITAFPTSATILTGTLNSGSAASLTSDNDVYYAVNSKTRGSRTAAWYGSFTGVASTLTNLRVNYKGKNSRRCTQAIAIWRWTSSTWVQLNSRRVGTTEVAVNDLTPSGSLTDYVSTAGSGELRVRVRCARASNFTARGDLLSIVYDAPGGPPGVVGALLRREGLYSSNVKEWRAAREREVHSSVSAMAKAMLH